MEHKLPKRRYTYNGAVVNQFGTLLASNWRAETMAESEAAAKRNLLWQFKNHPSNSYLAAPQFCKISLCSRPRLADAG